MPGTVVLLAASPVGKGCLLDAASVLPVLAAVSPPVLAGTDTANVVELVDPLEPHYAENATLTSLRNPLVQYRAGAAESLPCESGRYDLAIIENCIDHVRDVHGAMCELERVLGPRGVLYLTVNCRSRWGFFAHRALSNLRIDAGHPYTFTPDRLRRLLQAHGWTPVQFDVGSYDAARTEDLSAPELRSRIKGLLGISEYLVSVVATRH